MKNKSGMADKLHRAKVDAERERMARRVVDKALYQAVTERDNLRVEVADLRLQITNLAKPRRTCGNCAELKERAEILERERLRLGQALYDAGLLHKLKSLEELGLKENGAVE